MIVAAEEAVDLDPWFAAAGQDHDVAHATATDPAATRPRDPFPVAELLDRHLDDFPPDLQGASARPPPA